MEEVYTCTCGCQSFIIGSTTIICTTCHKEYRQKAILYDPLVWNKKQRANEKENP